MKTASQLDIASPVEFETGSATLRPTESTRRTLAKLVEILKNNPDIDTLSVDAYGKGDSGGEAHLSAARANAVVDYLVQYGIDRSRLTATGHGATHPLVSDDPTDPRNRRVEFHIASFKGRAIPKQFFSIQGHDNWTGFGDGGPVPGGPRPGGSDGG